LVAWVERRRAPQLDREADDVGRRAARHDGHCDHGCRVRLSSWRIGGLGPRS
jgi:hypothetical protein